MRKIPIGVFALYVLFCAPDAVDAQRPVSGTCSKPFPISTPRTVCSGSGCIGQDLCNDGTLTLVREELVVCECLHTCDWDDGSRRSTCAPCEGTKFYYEGVNSDELCEEHGGIEDSRWYVVSYLKDVGLYTSPTSPPNSGYQPGNDEVTCECLSGTDETACLDSDGPTTSTAPLICHDVCSTTKGTFNRGPWPDIVKDSPNCIEPEGDRGPETHCQCEDGPESVTWCTDDPSVCTDRGCVVHHTAPSSTRCLQVPVGVTTTTLPDRCSGVDNGTTAALNWLKFSVGHSYRCVDPLN